jgi:O-antigen ligase
LLAVAAAVVVAVAVLTIKSTITSEISQRASTVLSPGQVLKSSSATDREYELSLAIPSIKRHPSFGIGPGQSYGAVLMEPSIEGTTVIPRVFVQNLYVDVATDYGIPTALAFLLIPGFCLWFGLSRLRFASNSLDESLLAAGIATIVALMLSLLVGTYLQDPGSTAAFGITCGLVLATGLRTYPSTTSKDGRLDVRTSSE